MSHERLVTFTRSAVDVLMSAAKETRWPDASRSVEILAV